MSLIDLIVLVFFVSLGFVPQTWVGFMALRMIWCAWWPTATTSLWLRFCTKTRGCFYSRMPVVRNSDTSRNNFKQKTTEENHDLQKKTHNNMFCAFARGF